MRTYKIGRAPTNDIVLSDSTVSRQHAELEELGAGRFRLRDLGSSLGTKLLRGKQWIELDNAEILHDARIRFGEYETSPMDLLRDLDKTMMGAPSGPAQLGVTDGASAGRRRSGLPAAAPSQSSAKKQTTMWVLIGGGAFAFLVLLAVVIVLVIKA